MSDRRAVYPPFVSRRRAVSSMSNTASQQSGLVKSPCPVPRAASNSMFGLFGSLRESGVWCVYYIVSANVHVGEPICYRIWNTDPSPGNAHEVLAHRIKSFCRTMSCVKVARTPERLQWYLYGVRMLSLCSAVEGSHVVLHQECHV